MFSSTLALRVTSTHSAGRIRSSGICMIFYLYRAIVNLLANCATTGAEIEIVVRDMEGEHAFRLEMA